MIVRWWRLPRRGTGGNSPRTRRALRTRLAATPWLVREPFSHDVSDTAFQLAAVPDRAMPGTRWSPGLSLHYARYSAWRGEEFRLWLGSL